jgi:hypothetical protein
MYSSTVRSIAPALDRRNRRRLHAWQRLPHLGPVVWWPIPNTHAFSRSSRPAAGAAPQPVVAACTPILRPRGTKPAEALSSRRCYAHRAKEAARREQNTRRSVALQRLRQAVTDQIWSMAGLVAHRANAKQPKVGRRNMYCVGGTVMSTWYEGMEATSAALRQFEREHAGHRISLTSVDAPTLVLVTQCLDCAQEFREYSAPNTPVTSN